MSRLLPGQSPHDQKPPKTLAERVAASTTRLILIAIVSGGLLTAALISGGPIFQTPMTRSTNQTWLRPSTICCGKVSPLSAKS